MLNRGASFNPDAGTSRRAKRAAIHSQAATLWGQTIIGETGLSEDELLRFWDLFESLDTTKRGVLELPEVDYIFRKSNFWLSEKQVWALVQELYSSEGIAFDDLCMLLAKLYGRRPLSMEYFVRQFPRKAKEQLQKVFEILDKDGNNTLCEEEARRGLEAVNVRVQSEEHFAAIFREIDMNDSGTIDFGEFLVLMMKIRKPVPQISCAWLHLTEAEQKKFGDVFHAFDKGVKGLDAKELSEIFRALGFPADLQRTLEIVEEMDADSSGQMELEEFFFMLVRLGAGTARRTRVLLHPGATYEDAFKMGISLDLLWDLGYDDLRRLREAGWGPQELHAAKMGNLLDFRQAGFTASELRKAGWHAKDLKLTGYSTAELRIGGFSAAALSRVSRDFTGKCIDVEGPQDVSFPLPLRPLTPVGARRNSYLPTPALERPQSAPRRLSRWWSTPRIQQLVEGPRKEFKNSRPPSAARSHLGISSPPLSAARSHLRGPGGLPSRPVTAP